MNTKRNLLIVACLAGLSAAIWVSSTRGKTTRPMPLYSVRDTFTAADDTPITGVSSDIGGPWTRNTAYAVVTPPKVLNNRLCGGHADPAIYYAAGAAGGGFGAVFNIESIAGYSWIMVGPGTDAYTGYIVFPDPVSVSGVFWRINRVIDGAGLSFANYAELTAVPGDSRQVDVTASVDVDSVDIVVLIDGVQRMTFSDTSPERITDLDTFSVGFADIAATANTGIHLDSVYAANEIQTTRPLAILEGNSQITGGYNTLPADIIDGLTVSADSVNISTAAETLDDFIADVATEINLRIDDRRRRIVVYVQDATNSYYLPIDNGLDGQEVYDKTCDLADAIHALDPDIKVIVSTTPHRTWLGLGEEFPADPPDINDRIDDGNALIVANADGKFAAVVDIAAILHALGGTGVYTSDGVHLNQTGADAIQPTISATISRFLGAGVVRSRLINVGAGALGSTRAALVNAGGL
jgi:hypothetical protein